MKGNTNKDFSSKIKNNFGFWKKEKNFKKKSFTLTELIIVIIIMAVLATIWFTTISGYPSLARDSIRKADLKSIEENMNIYKVRTWKFPTPDNPKIPSSQTWWIDWEFSLWVQKELKNIVDLPIDPKTSQNYSYMLKEDGVLFKVIANLETGEEYVVWNYAVSWLAWIVDAINWACWITINTCTAWSFLDVVDSTTQNLWSCNWLDWWSDASCSIDIPIAWVCWSTVNSCTAWNFVDVTNISGYYRWRCEGTGWWANIDCYRTIPISWYCWSAIDTCLSWYFVDLIDPPTQHRWRCSWNHAWISVLCLRPKTCNYSWQNHMWVCISPGIGTPNISCNSSRLWMRVYDWQYGTSCQSGNWALLAECVRTCY